MSGTHRVFVSYHHDNDQARKNIFDLRFGNRFGIIKPGSVNLGDIDPNLATETVRQKVRDEFMRDCSVTVVLVGTQTWQRKHVDWEIGITIRDTLNNPRAGLLGVILPSYAERHGRSISADARGNVLVYDRYTIPPRLHDNIDCGFASLHMWTEDPDRMQQWIHEAYLRKSRTGIEPDNSYPSFANNRSGDRWYP